MKKSILILALLGDPLIMPGFRHAGGYNKTLSELIEFIATLNLKCNIITNTNEYTQAKSIKINSNIMLYRIQTDMELIVNQDLLYERQDDLLTQITDILNNNNCNPILIHSFYWISGILADTLAKKYHISFIHTPISLTAEKERTGTFANSKYQYSAECKFLKNADRILSISSEEAKLLKGFYSIKQEKIIIVGRSVSKIFHNPAHTSQGFPSAPKLNPIFYPQLYSTNTANQWWLKGSFTYVGRLAPIKGILHIVNAWITLYEKYNLETPPLWVIGGDIIAIQAIRKQIDRQNILELCEEQQKIIWWGVLDSAGISTLLLKTSVLVSHSRFEAGGRMILEAMCQNTPVIATSTGFAVDLIISGYNGYITEFSDQLELCKYMEYFVKQPYLSNSMGNLAKKTYLQVEKTFNFFQIHQIIYQHYLDGIPYKSTLTDHVKLMTEYDFIDVFPYNDIGFTDKEVTSIWLNDNKKVEGIIQRVEATHFYLWKVSGRTEYYIKQFYNIVNFRSLWSIEKETHAIHASTLYEKAIYSLKFPHILTCTNLYPNYCMYIAPQFSDITNDELFFDAFSCTMQSFSSFVQNKDMDFLCNIYHGFSPTNLDNAIEELLQCNMEIDDYLIVEQIYRWIQRTPNSYNIKGLSYGKSLLHHVLKHNDTYILLPTSTWFWGTLGLDYALTLLEIYSLHTYSLKVLENYLAEILFIPSQQILFWMVYCILLKKYYNNNLGIPACDMMLLNDILKLLKNVCH